MAKAKKAAKRPAAKRAKPAPRAAGPRTPAKVAPVPPGYHTVTSYLTVADGAAALDFYTQAFGAKVTQKMPGPGGKLMHAEFRIGDSIVMLSDEFPQGGTKSPRTLNGSTGSLFLYVPNVDAAFKRAVDAGCQVTMPLMDMFWGDRFGRVTDPFGHHWGLASHKEDVSPAEINRRTAVAMSQMGQNS
jgi:PhnB protein